MRLATGRELSSGKSWEGFQMKHDKLELPNGRLLTAQEILLGAALAEIQSELELMTTSKLLQFARVLAKIYQKGK